MTTWSNGIAYELAEKNCFPIGYDGDALIYNSKNQRGVIDAYSAVANQGGRSLTSYANHLTLTNRGASDVLGSQALLTIATNLTDTMTDSAPGVGTNNEIWLWDLAADSGYALVTGRSAVIWPRFLSPTRLVWSQMTTAPAQAGKGNTLGLWALHTADITGSGIENEYTYTGAGFGQAFYETYPSFDGGATIVFASNFGITPPGSAPAWMASQLWMMPDEPGATPTRLSPAMGGVNAYHEFCWAAPAGMFDDSNEWIVFGMSDASLGLELWAMQRSDTTGATCKRLTYFNSAGYACTVAAVFPPGTTDTVLVGVQNTPIEEASTDVDCYQLTIPKGSA